MQKAASRDRGRNKPDVYNARLPVRFRGRRGDGMKPESIREQLVPIPIDTLWGQDLEITDQDLTLTIDRFGERYVEPAVAIIANMIDGDLADQFVNVFSVVGTPGTVPTSLTTFTAAGVKLNNLACPPGLRSAVVNPDTEANLLGFVNNTFNPAKTISDQYLTGKMGLAVGQKFSMDQNIGRQVVGLVTGTAPQVHGANQSGSSLITNNWGVNNTQVLNAGDVIQLEGVDSVNPISFRDTGKLADFVVTADATTDGGGAVTLSIAPDINFDASSPFQTVMNTPADATPIRVYNQKTGAALNAISGVSTAQNLVFHRDAFCLAIVKQELPGGMEWSEFAASPKSGYWIRLVRGYSILDNKKYTRFDVLGGKKTIRPELAVRVCA